MNPTFDRLVESAGADISELARNQGGAVTGTQVDEAVGRKRLTHLVASGALIKLWRNAYALPDTARLVQTRLAAADLTIGSATVIVGSDASSEPAWNALWAITIPAIPIASRAYGCTSGSPSSADRAKICRNEDHERD